MHFEKTLFAFEEDLGKKVQLVNYCEVVEGRLSEIRWKVVTADACVCLLTHLLY